MLRVVSCQAMLLHKSTIVSAEVLWDEMTKIFVSNLINIWEGQMVRDFNVNNSCVDEFGRTIFVNLRPLLCFDFGWHHGQRGMTVIVGWYVIYILQNIILP